jgi:mercuric ion binding protein
MKYLLFTSLLALIFSCSKMQNKEAEFYVRGNCEMCKERIETSLKATNGVTNAVWDVKSSVLKVSYDSTLVKEMELHKAVASTGHGTKLVEMNGEAHDALPECCKVGASSMK